MSNNEGAFLLNERGEHLPLVSGPPGAALREGSEVIDDAVNSRGFVLVTLAHRAVVIELCPHRVQPRAVREASRIVTRAQAECVLLARAGDAWRRSKYEFFGSRRAARAALLAVARSADRRLTFEGKLRGQAPDGWVPGLFGDVRYFFGWPPGSERDPMAGADTLANRVA
jgi:hypothetical protein